MSVTNKETTGRTSYCIVCGKHIEEALLLKGLAIADKAGHAVPSPGVPTWRSTDRGWGSARCATAPDAKHAPGGSAAGSAFQR